jgi:predicted MFS family arabinose efflux permease
MCSRARAALIFGALVIALALGIRQAFGLFLEPVVRDFEIGRASFGFAIALQNLVWGLAQPFAGAFADRYGSGRVIALGSALYAAGLALATVSRDAVALDLTLGVLIGLGLSGTTFAVVLGAIGRLYPPERRSVALGIGTALGSLGLFTVVPGAQLLLEGYGWVPTFLVLACASTLGIVFAPGLAGRPENRSDETRPSEAGSLGEALNQARRHGGYWLLTTGFFVCGFQLAFIATHLPAYLSDRAVAGWVAGAVLAVIGLFNIAGSYICGVIGARMSKSKSLAWLYIARSAIILAFLVLPITPVSALVFAALMGLLWVGTVPLTSGLVAQIFGVRYMATLFGIVFLAHQIGSFLGAWLGGVVYEATGSYLPVWIASMALGLVAAALHWPISERPISDQGGAARSDAVA